jgi:hypothetical protein
MSELTILANTSNTLNLNGKVYRVSPPTLQDLAEAESFGKELKQNKRKDYIKQYTELFSQLPKEMLMEEKKQIINSILPSNLTPKDKIDLLAAMPDSWDDEKKNKQLMRLVLERDGVEWMETLYILWLCIRKNQPDVTLEDIKNCVTADDLDNILKVISPKKTGSSEKNV